MPVNACPDPMVYRLSSLFELSSLVKLSFNINSNLLTTQSLSRLANKALTSNQTDANWRVFTQRRPVAILNLINLQHKKLRLLHAWWRHKYRIYLFACHSTSRPICSIHLGICNPWGCTINHRKKASVRWRRSVTSLMVQLSGFGAIIVLHNIDISNHNVLLNMIQIQ